MTFIIYCVVSFVIGYLLAQHFNSSDDSDKRPRVIIRQTVTKGKCTYYGIVYSVSGELLYRSRYYERRKDAEKDAYQMLEKYKMRESDATRES